MAWVGWEKQLKEREKRKKRGKNLVIPLTFWGTIRCRSFKNLPSTYQVFTLCLAQNLMFENWLILMCIEPFSYYTSTINKERLSTGHNLPNCKVWNLSPQERIGPTLHTEKQDYKSFCYQNFSNRVSPCHLIQAWNGGDCDLYKCVLALPLLCMLGEANSRALGLI